MEVVASSQVEEDLFVSVMRSGSPSSTSAKPHVIETSSLDHAADPAHGKDEAANTSDMHLPLAGAKRRETNGDNEEDDEVRSISAMAVKDGEEMSLADRGTEEGRVSSTKDNGNK